MAAYVSLLWAGLHLIHIGCCSPDMMALSLKFLACYFLLKIQGGTAAIRTYAALGAVLGLGYLARAAFLPLVPICIAVAAVLLWRRRLPVLRPTLWIAAAAAVVIAPFVAAISAAAGHLDFGSTGRLNYAWEVCGAPRTIHWQGEPGDIGAPAHTTRKVLDHPATYTFTDDVPGAYPLWYRPSYWFEGVRPHLKIGPQLKVLAADTKFLAYLFIQSPVLVPCLVLVALAGWRKWLSAQGIGAYWFLLLPLAASIGLYCLVFLDRRYIAGCLVVIWTCVIASLALPPRLLRRSNLALVALVLLFSAGFWAKWMLGPAAELASDALHRRESEWNLQWMLAERFRGLGVRPGDRVAYIGQSIDADWVRMDGAKIVAEVPIIWDHLDQLNRFVEPNQREVEAFWRADAGTRGRVLQAFRDAGAVIVVADKAPTWALAQGWRQVLPPGTPHLPTDGGEQQSFALPTAWMRLTDVPSQ